MTTITHTTIVQVLWPVASHPMLRALVLACSGVILITASAKTQIPFYPVPMTLQTMVVLLLGMAYGPKLAVATIGAYLAVGAMGMPVFAGTPEKGIGLAYMLGTTGGYLLGFLLAAVVCGELARRGFDSAIWKVAVAMVAGNLLIYAVGLMWLGLVVGWDKPILEWGLYPFLLGDAAKIVFAAVTLPLLSKAVRKVR